MVINKLYTKFIYITPHRLNSLPSFSKITCLIDVSSSFWPPKDWICCLIIKLLLSFNNQKVMKHIYGTWYTVLNIFILCSFCHTNVDFKHIFARNDWTMKIFGETIEQFTKVVIDIHESFMQPGSFILENFKRIMYLAVAFKETQSLR